MSGVNGNFKRKLACILNTSSDTAGEVVKLKSDLDTFEVAPVGGGGSSNLQEAYNAQNGVEVTLAQTQKISNDTSYTTLSNKAIQSVVGASADGKGYVNAYAKDGSYPAEVNLAMTKSGTTSAKMGVKINDLGMPKAFVSGVPLEVVTPVSDTDAVTKLYVDEKTELATTTQSGVVKLGTNDPLVLNITGGIVGANLDGQLLAEKASTTELGTVRLATGSTDLTGVATIEQVIALINEMRPNV